MVTMAKRQSTPLSREVRLSQGTLHGDYENIAYDIYSGDSDSLLKGIVRLELTDELRRSKAIEQFKIMLLGQMATRGGLLGFEDLNQVTAEWHERAALDSWEQES
jgi:hypothetical protein